MGFCFPISPPLSRFGDVYLCCPVSAPMTGPVSLLIVTQLSHSLKQETRKFKYVGMLRHKGKICELRT